MPIALGSGTMHCMAGASVDDWERRYNPSIQAEDARHGRVPGEFTFTEAQTAAEMFLGFPALIAAGIGWVGTKVGVTYQPGAWGAVAALAAVEGVVLCRWNQRQTQ